MSATVLLIDYDPCSICKIRGILGTAGLRSIVAHDGVSGLEAFDRYRPDLALVQDLIPRKHGFEVCKEIKSTERGSVTPVLLIAHVRNGRRYAVLATGCDDYVEKPLDGRILLEKVLRFLPAPEPETAGLPADAPIHPDPAEPGKTPGKEKPVSRRRASRRSRPTGRRVRP